MRRAALLGLALCLLACPKKPGSECDRDKLRALSADLEGAAAETDVVPLVAEGLAAACGDALPRRARASLSLQAPGDQREAPAATEPDERWAAMVERACPGSAKVLHAVAEAPADQRGLVAYRGCGFERFGLLGEDEARAQSGIVAWTLHQWLLDQGMSAEEARPITGALFVAERRAFTLVFPLEGQRVPKAPGAQLESGAAIYVGPQALVFDEKQLATMSGGRISADAVENNVVEALRDALAEEADKSRAMAEQRGEAWDGRVILIADERVAFSTLVNVLYTAGLAGYDHYALAVQERPWEFAQIAVEPPEFPVNAKPGQVDASTVMTMEIELTSVSVRSSDPLSSREYLAEFDDFAPVTAFARELKEDDPGAHRTVFTAADDVTVGRIVAALAAARGPGCSDDGPECILPHVVVTGAGAHGYRPEGLQTEVDPGAVPEPGSLAELVAAAEPRRSIMMANGIGTVAEPLPTARWGPITAKGELDPAVVRRILRHGKPGVDACYEAARKEDPALAGRLDLEIVVDDAGTVKSAKASAELGKELAGCLEARAMEWKFPRELPVQVDIPWVFAVE